MHTPVPFYFAFLFRSHSQTKTMDSLGNNGEWSQKNDYKLGSKTSRNGPVVVSMMCKIYSALLSIHQTIQNKMSMRQLDTFSLKNSTTEKTLLCHFKYSRLEGRKSHTRYCNDLCNSEQKVINL